MKRYIGLIILMGLLLSACKPAIRKESRTVFLLGTVCSVQLFTDKPQTESERILHACTERLKALELYLSANADDSDLTAINRAAGKKSVRIPADLYPVFERAVFFAEKTSGAFNPVIGSVVKLWNIGFDNARVPPARAINETLAFTDYTALTLQEGECFLQKAGMQLDLGGIAKGFAADECARIIKAHHIDNALIDIGGTVTALGVRPDGKPLIIGIRDPRLRQGEPIMAVIGHNKSIATSGSYERYFEQDGVRYHHIIDPATGYPVRNNLIAVSVFSNSATDADALSTACFVLGYEKAVKLLAELPDTEALFIFEDNSVRATGDLEKNIVILNSAFRFADTNKNVPVK